MEGAARKAHLALYALLLLVPALGMVATWLRGEAVQVLGLFSLSSPLTAERAMSRAVKGAHELAANLLIGLVLAHVAAALFHQLVLRDGPLGRMRLPWRGWNGSELARNLSRRAVPHSFTRWQEPAACDPL
jgi:cytochrome b561